MTSLRDKLKSKIKSKQEQPQTMESFDQNSLKVSLTQGKTQLIEIKIHCAWNNSKNTQKIPKMNCKWYNRTENNIQQIIGIEEDSFQPSIIDVGSIIQVTCIPQLPGATYEGMPIVLKSTPISLSAETENQANQLLSQGKAKFFVDFKEGKIHGKNFPHNCQGLIKLQGNILSLCHVKFGQLNDEILKQIKINELCPQYVINRRITREMTLKFSQQQFCTFYLKNHELRDTFCLLNKLIIAKSSLQKIQVTQTINVEEKQISTETFPSETFSKDEINQGSSQSFDKQQKLSKSQQYKSGHVELKQKDHLIRTAEKQNKQSAGDLLQLMNLKQEVKKCQIENAKLIKQNQAEREKIYVLERKIEQTKERLQNGSKNYFNLQRQLESARQANKVLQKQIEQFHNVKSDREQQILYYKNQIKILQEQKRILDQTIIELNQKDAENQKELSKFKVDFHAGDKKASYQQLTKQLDTIKEINSELKLKYQYSIQEKQKVQQNLKNSRNIIQQIEAEKKYIQKKYQSLTNQISSPTMMSRLSEKSMENSLSNSFVFEEIPILDRRDSSNTAVNLTFLESDNRQKQLLQLKRQLKDVVEQNNYVKGLLAKEKKPTSKSHLKLQLFQLKKLANRLSQNMIEKDMCIQNLKEINRELNRRNQQLQAECLQLRNSL